MEKLKKLTDLAKNFDKATKKERMMVYACGAALLLLLNFTRDTYRTIKSMEWSRVERKTLNRTVTSLGALQANNLQEVVSEVNEEVLEKYVKEGDRVKKGELLLKLSRTRTQIDFDQQKNNYADAEAAHTKAVKDLKVQQRLFKNFAVPKSAVEDARENLRKARASLGIAKKTFEIQKKRLDDTDVKANIDGIVLQDFVQKGSKVNSGNPIITIGDISQFLVKAKVDELDIPQVQVGQKVRINVDAYPGKPMEGVVKSIASQALRDIFAKIQVKIDITDAKGLPLKHNLSVRAQILTEPIPDAIGIPVKSVQKKVDKKGWVIVKNRLKIIREKKVTLGRLAGDEVEVVKGLSAGQEVGIFKPGESPL